MYIKMRNGAKQNARKCICTKTEMGDQQKIITGTVHVF